MLPLAKMPTDYLQVAPRNEKPSKLLLADYKFQQDTVEKHTPETVAHDTKRSSLKPSAPPSRAARSRSASAKNRRLRAKNDKPEPSSPLQEQVDAPSVNAAGCALRLDTSNGPVVVEVTAEGCRLAYPHILLCPQLAKWMPTPVFIKALQAAGMDLFPALSTDYQPTVLKAGAWPVASIACCLMRLG